MGLSTRDAERLGDGVFSDRFIGDDIYCATCGYNLRTQPFTGLCPECAAEYNARPLKLINIFQPDLIAFPSGMLVGAIVTTSLALAFFWLAWNRSSQSHAALGVVVGVLALFYVSTVWTRVSEYIRAQRILSRIRDEADDDDEWLELLPDDR